jgi:hypothetical protein
MAANALTRYLVRQGWARGLTFGRIGVLVIALCPVLAEAQPPDTSALKEVIVRDSARIRDIFLADSLRRDSVFKGINRVMVQLGRLPWMIPEAHDEQPLPDGGGKYGPKAYIFASPYIDGFRTNAQFFEHGTRGVLVAVVYVNAPVNAALPTTYRNLQLSGGVNCVWLSLTRPAGVDTWRAYVTPATVSDSTCAEPTPPPTLLAVRRTTSFPNHADYPPVARFSEAQGGQPLLSTKCVRGWCEIGPSAFLSKAALIPVTVASARETRVKGWHDEQQLAVDAGGGVMLPGPYATVRPVRNLEGRSAASFRSQWVRVATIHFSTAPTAGTTYANWGLRAGSNHLDLILFEGRWVGRIVRADGSIRYWPHVQRHVHHDAPVPGTARFRWTAADEGVWVLCGQACCLVDGAQ